MQVRALLAPAEDLAVNNRKIEIGQDVHGQVEALPRRVAADGRRPDRERREAGQVHGNDRSGSPCHRSRDEGRIERVVRGDVGEDRRATTAPAVANAERPQGEEEGIGAGVEPVRLMRPSRRRSPGRSRAFIAARIPP